MKSFAAGTLLGAAIGAAALFVWMSPNEEPSKEQMTWEEPGTTKKEETPSAEKPRTKRNPFDIVETQPAGPTVAQTGAATPKSTPAQSEPSAISPPTTKVLSDRSIAAADPIPMSEAHREMLMTVREDGKLVGEKHVALEQEARDESWSHYMEQMLGSYLSGRAPRVGVEIVNITCRTSACEIQGYDNNGPNALSALLGEATKESWWEFSSMDASAADYGTRTRTLIFLGRHKKTKEAQRKQVT